MAEDKNQDQQPYYESARALNERIFKAKARERKRLAALSFDEKIKILERLRDREKILAEARRKLRESNAAASKGGRKGLVDSIPYDCPLEQI